MDEQFREIEGLLECTDHVQTRSFKKYAKIIIPHVVLVLTVCLYAIIGSLIFYHFEAPHEENLKINGVRHIDNLRKDLIQTMWSFKIDNTNSYLNSDTIHDFYSNMERKLEIFNSDVFKAFKDQYVRYDNVKVSSNYTNLQNSRSRKYRKANSKNDKSGQLWTHSSSLFFAATTMATIGYGNIVPVTPQGRIACVIFALFGAPLAIITIGDLGKFLSECTIWLYKNIIKVRKTINLYYTRWSNIRKGVTTEVDETVSTHKSVSRSNIDWDDLDKTEVPVLLVFAILLLYIALGGILFAILESWTYMDAFYYCFVSLTTIGFGDFVPERHEYIVIMLIYLFVGLAVTTMCIDLVGIQYIQKIHYFGRKFRGTDILQLLKRKRMIERRIALGQGEEILQMCLTHMAKEQIQVQIPMKNMVPYVKPDLPKKYAKAHSLSPHNSIVSYFSNNSKNPSLNSDIAIISEKNYFSIATSCSIPTIYTGSLPESPYTISSASRRSMMYERFENRENSWIESGPDISFHCSISTSPSVYERELQYDNRHSPSPSIQSFKYEFPPDPIPSPDIKEISDSVKRMKRSLSCGGIIEHIHSKSPSNTSLQTQSSVSVRKSLSICGDTNTCFHAIECFASIPPLFSRCISFNLHAYNSPFSNVDFLFLFKKLHQQTALSNCELESSLNLVKFLNCPQLFDAVTCIEHKLLINPPIVLFNGENTSYALSESIEQVSYQEANHFKDGLAKNLKKWLLMPRNERRQSFHFDEGAIQVTDIHRAEPILKRKKHERIKRKKSPTHKMDWLNISPRTPFIGDTSSPSSAILSRKPSINLQLPVPVHGLTQTTGLHCMVSWEQPVQIIEGESLENVFYSPVKSLENLDEPEVHKILEEKKPGVWKEANISDISEPSHIIFSPMPEPIELTPTIFNDDFELELNTIVEQVSPEPPLSSYVSMDGESSNFFEDDSSSSSNSPAFDIDLGAFELVNSGMTAESLLNQEEPVIYHKDMPVHSVHHDTVQTEAALENLMNAPKSMLSCVVPPTMVADNYCFVVDGDKVKFDDIMGDDQWWRHTSRPTKYFYSDDMKKFTRVNCITAKGKIISARIAATSTSNSVPNSATLMISSSTSSTLNAGGSSSIQSSTTPRPSFSVSARSSGGGLSGRGEKVSLDNVYKVIRFYSFWKTCTSFHRICTMIDKVTDSDKESSSPGFKRRLFVQYLWRNAKPSDKIRVQKEFDPRRQRLLRFVTAENAQKKRSSVVRNEKPEHPFSRSSSTMKRNS
ncbi:Potassium channel subfamily K member 18 [Strongyloides ratti]|uniref:Potassium channel subfamily K member 18 n=1 Tax=Strongyloides ratti TaxID=34506 RepID=A0A090LT12_STRRB|nr:Potassium channel subfamily K member 18 [Strongyloides ratti]CEF70719.1 Potassium channel subfamily K member 18 [Strongyloides ratti]